MGLIRPGFEEFAQRELPALLRYATMLTGETELARDLVQDVMVKTHRNWDRVSGSDYPARYVKTILTRTHLSWRRRWSVRNVVLSDTGELTPPAIPDHAIALVDREDLWQRMAALPRMQRAVLVLRFYEHLTDSEIAETLGCSSGTVRGYASRALATLRLQLTDDLEPSEETS